MAIGRYAFAAGIFGAACFANAASAQQAGTYSGTIADGSTISFTLGADSSTGSLQVQSFNFNFKDACSPGAFTFDSGWGLGGNGPDITGSKSTYTYSFGYLYMTATMKFSGSGVTGTILNATPTFVAPTTAGSEPKKAAYCSSKKQTYSATLGSPPPSVRSTRLATSQPRLRPCPLRF